MQEESISIHDYLDIVYRKKWLIVLVFACVFLATLYIVQKQPQQYASGSKIYLEYVAGNTLPTLAELAGGRKSSQRSVEFYLGVFNSSSFRRAVHHNLVGHAIRLGMNELDAAEISGQTLRSLRMLSWRYEGYYRITVRSATPDIAFAADSIATGLYAEHCRIIANQEAETMAQFVEVQFDSARENLTRAEESLQEFRRRNNLFPLSSGGRTAASGLTIEYQRLVESYYDARRDRQAAQASLDAAVQNAALLESSLDTLGRDWITRANPQRELSEMRDLARRAQTELKLKEFQERSFEGQLRQYENEHPELTEIAVTHMRLVRERDIYEDLTSQLIQRREELRLAAKSESGGVRIIDEASSGAKIPTDAATTLSIGAAIGLVFGVGLAFLWEMMDSNVKTSADVRRATGLSVVGTVPRITLGRQPKRGGRGRSYVQRALLLSEAGPRGPVAEAYRTLRTSLLYSVADKDLKTLVISSPGQSEGKSLTTANLAITCAQMGQRTLLIDGDLRRPVQHTLFGIDREIGLTDLLLRDLTLEEVAKPSGVENLDIVSAGVTPPNPAPLLASEEMSRRLDEMEAAYDLVLIDSPPVIAVTDPVLLGRMGDGMILVVRCAATPRAAVQHAAGLLESSQVPVLGCILNDVDVSRHYGGYHYYYYYYHYYYGYYGSESKDAAKAAAAEKETTA